MSIFIRSHLQTWPARLTAVVAVPLFVTGLIFTAIGFYHVFADSSEGTVVEDGSQSGQDLFEQSCSGCHGADATGIPGLGKNLVESDFVHRLNDDELFDFIVTGRLSFHPDNTTGLDMPARGGNPLLSDSDIQSIVSYLRSLSNNQQNQNTEE